MKRFHIVTLGCKVNQCESAAMGHLLEEAGLQPVRDGAPDVVVINTCTVTGKAAMQSRQAIRQARRKHPTAEIIVTGCYAQTAPAEIQAIGGIQRIVGHADKMRIAELISAPCDGTSFGALGPAMDPACPFAALPSVSREARTRAFLKIQDGCNTRCTYCIVPHARGPSRSMPSEDVGRHARLLGADGFLEVVLTGIHLGAYGADLRPPIRLAELLTTLTAEPTGVARLRISSIEPTEVDDSIIDAINNAGPRLCRHLHIPLQSGDDTVLRRMGRPYSSERFAQTIATIRRRIPGVAIGVDVMAGFPGESEEAFENTYRLIEVLPITYLHVFPFSPRKGTPAAAFKPRVPESVAKERCRRLRHLGEEKRAAFHRAQVGQTLRVLIESEAEEKKGPAQGLSDNYVPVAIPDPAVKANTLVNVRVMEISADGRVIGSIR
ncbi:MAG: tRNA (N(6)-L-threonylcarbamoyladenosine(37)-C(2))-methylthiotransferase MtaB [Desulfobacterales bacterium]|nr:tRNA (N(6)-L-threonylcarbamoyladenosine(37)-C(2))-methylthiotransferase MtaB [Desulfobacterales bacterium]